jgi:hypothetical protein
VEDGVPHFGPELGLGVVLFEEDGRGLPEELDLGSIIPD